jgi:hypothetical protein
MIAGTRGGPEVYDFACARADFVVACAAPEPLPTNENGIEPFEFDIELSNSFWRPFCLRDLVLSLDEGTLYSSRCESPASRLVFSKPCSPSFAKLSKRSASRMQQRVSEGLFKGQDRAHR